MDARAVDGRMARRTNDNEAGCRVLPDRFIVLVVLFSVLDGDGGSCAVSGLTTWCRDYGRPFQKRHIEGVSQTDRVD